MTPDEFDAALAALGWKGTDFCERAGLVPNTVWRWRKGAVAIPRWVGEYLRAMLAIQRLHGEFVAPQRGNDRAVRQVATVGGAGQLGDADAPGREGAMQ